MVVSPVPPDAPDIMQIQLFSSKICCFFDGNARMPPRTDEDFLQSNYISLTFMAGRRRSGENQIMKKIEKNIIVRVSNFAGIASFMRDSELLAIVPERLINSSLADFSKVTFPYAPPELRIYMLWHQKNQNDPSHQWLRKQLLEIPDYS